MEYIIIVFDLYLYVNISAGILPACYENIVIEVELQEQSNLSCSMLNEDRTVTRPMGNILSKLKMRGKNTIYGSKEACLK
jgi:transposase